MSVSNSNKSIWTLQLLVTDLQVGSVQPYIWNLKDQLLQLFLKLIETDPAAAMKLRTLYCWEYNIFSKY